MVLFQRPFKTKISLVVEVIASICQTLNSLLVKDMDFNLIISQLSNLWWSLQMCHTSSERGF